MDEKSVYIQIKNKNYYYHSNVVIIVRGFFFINKSSPLHKELRQVWWWLCCGSYSITWYALILIYNQYFLFVSYCWLCSKPEHLASKIDGDMIPPPPRSTPFLAGSIGRPLTYLLSCFKLNTWRSVYKVMLKAIEIWIVEANPLDWDYYWCAF